MESVSAASRYHPSMRPPFWTPMLDRLLGMDYASILFIFFENNCPNPSSSRGLRGGTPWTMSTQTIPNDCNHLREFIPCVCRLFQGIIGGSYH